MGWPAKGARIVARVMEMIRKLVYVVSESGTVQAIGLLAIPISIAGLICLVVGIIPATMWITAAFASLYHAVSASGEV